ncbi:DUF2764 family protein [Kiritimatiella glycovorans]|uniref:V-type ATP synthase subunit C n=1 Tax=Kiritimatiella glycovorans TaxID=1307763 RepID=A0A0G3EK49_9BACT|nr:DUF2764 family protein [Kiritimatiella glycovorans]AKJ64529.1 V-type ATP synthase subunit C [Kiritimatiella glycovorans]
MAHVYLASTLPALRFTGEPPFSGDTLLFRCAGVLDGDEQHDVERVLRRHDKAPRTDVARRWVELELSFSAEIARVRAARAGMERPRTEGYTGIVEDPVERAFAVENPAGREDALDLFRWNCAEDLAREAPFGFPAVLAFAVQLGILERRAAFDRDQGRETVERLVAEKAQVQW